MKGADFVDKILCLFGEKSFNDAMEEIKRYKYTNRQKNMILKDWMIHQGIEGTNFEQLYKLVKFLCFNN